MKFLGFITILLIGAIGHAQLSDLHYLPPLRQAQNGNINIKEQAIYLSTPETTPFTVNAYRGTSTAVFATFTISNTNPAVYTLPNGNNDITLVFGASTGIVISDSGLRFEAPGGEEFYVNYRGASDSQGASLTSKGRQAMGTNFKWGGVPNYGTTIADASSTLGIMATEANTTVTISGYDSNCEFRIPGDANGLTSDVITVTLNEGQSYVLEAKTDANPANVDGWLGASITSDKNIVISNGMVNYAPFSGSRNARDAGIDQPVPENNLGKEYIFIRGNGTNNTEFVNIIATQNNTDIFVNGSAIPIATINDGEYFIIPATNYSGTTAGANMLVQTSKDAYAYQNITGSSANNTIGLNFVAPLNCLLPDTLDNIPDITNFAGTTLNGGITIIASTTTPDANISVTDGTGNIGSLTSQPVAGSTDWKTFFVSGLTGDVSVQSSGPIAVGFFGANTNRGVAGYFSGFDTTPNVNLQITGGGCLPGGTIEITTGNFDAYQWYDDNGNPISGETTSTYTPSTPGDYFVRVNKGGCVYDSNPISVYYCNPDIQLIKTADQTVIEEGDTVTFTITVQNFNVDPATNLVVTDELPLGLSVVSATPSAGIWSAPNWTIGNLNSGQLETLTITAMADDLNNMPYRRISNIAFNTQDQTDTNISEDSPFVSVLINYDNDDDTIIDSFDLDDDNDGILDTTECANTTTNLALSGTATLSSTISAQGQASNAIDNDTNGVFSAGSVANSGNSGTTAWLTIDLGQEEFIDEVHFWNRTDACCTTRTAYAYVMISTDPFPSNTNLDESLANAEFIFQLGDTDGVVDVAIPAGIIGRYVRIQQSNNLALNVAELQVFGPITCDTDSDNITDIYDLDSDDDGCSDVNEAYADSNTDGGDNAYYGTGNPPVVDTQGRVTSASYPSPADGDSNSVPDFQEAGAIPVIINEPVDDTVCPSGDTSFSVTATGADVYQWQQLISSTWTDISNSGIHTGTSTATLTITNAQISDSGNQYRVLISSNTYICAPAISQTATLVVAEPTANAGANQTICDGDSVSLSATASGGTPGYNYLWNTGQTTSDITFTPTGDSTADTTIDYSVTVTDQNGCQSSDTVTVTIESAPTVSVTTTDARCGLDNGIIRFTFNDHPNRTSIEFSLDGGATYETNVADDSGFVDYTFQAAGTYNVWTRWGNNECPLDLGNVTISTVSEVALTTQPTNQTVFVNANAMFSIATTDADTYQWQVSANGGGSFTNLSDGTEYSGTQTTNLTVNTVDLAKNGYLYRCVVSNSATLCPALVSNAALLNVRVARVITNRRITYRVKKQ